MSETFPGGESGYGEELLKVVKPASNHVTHQIEAEPDEHDRAIDLIADMQEDCRELMYELATGPEQLPRGWGVSPANLVELADGFATTHSLLFTTAEVKMKPLPELTESFRDHYFRGLNQYPNKEEYIEKIMGILPIRNPLLEKHIKRNNPDGEGSSTPRGDAYKLGAVVIYDALYQKVEMNELMKAFAKGIGYNYEPFSGKELLERTSFQI